MCRLPAMRGLLPHPSSARATRRRGCAHVLRTESRQRAPLRGGTPLVSARGTVRVVLQESTERRLPFVSDLMASLADEVIVADTQSALATSEDVSLVIVACGEWTEVETAICAEASSERTGVPLLVISGPTPPALRTAALRAGADEFICIPFEIDELAARMFALVRLSTRGSAHRAGVFVVDAV